MSPSTRFPPLYRRYIVDPGRHPADIDAPCSRAARHRVAAECVNPAWVHRCVESLAGSSVAVAAVVGLPLWGERPCHKGGRGGARDGAGGKGARHGRSDPLDAGWALARGRTGYGRRHSRDEGALVKMIIESALLTPEEIVHACEIARELVAQHTSTLAPRELGQ